MIWSCGFFGAAMLLILMSALILSFEVFAYFADNDWKAKNAWKDYKVDFKNKETYCVGPVILVSIALIVSAVFIPVSLSKSHAKSEVSKYANIISEHEIKGHNVSSGDTVVIDGVSFLVRDRDFNEYQNDLTIFRFWYERSK